jgi:hypothetical protein
MVRRLFGGSPEWPNLLQRDFAKPLG